MNGVMTIPIVIWAVGLGLHAGLSSILVGVPVWEGQERKKSLVGVVIVVTVLWYWVASLLV